MATKNKAVAFIQTRFAVEIQKALVKAQKGEAGAFRKLADELARGLEEGAYQSFKVSYSELRRKRIPKDGAPVEGQPGRVFDIEITYSGRRSPKLRAKR